MLRLLTSIAASAVSGLVVSRDALAPPQSAKAAPATFNATGMPRADTIPFCYPPSDRDFFPPGDPGLDYNDCLLAIVDFVKPFSLSTFTLWYTSDQRPPPGLPDFAIQMPLYVHNPDCSLAVISTKALADLVLQKGMRMREEWDYPFGATAIDEFDDIDASMIFSIDGFRKVLPACRDTGSAGHGLIGRLAL